MSSHLLKPGRTDFMTYDAMFPIYHSHNCLTPSIFTFTLLPSVLTRNVTLVLCVLQLWNYKWIYWIQILLVSFLSQLKILSNQFERWLLWRLWRIWLAYILTQVDNCLYHTDRVTTLSWRTLCLSFFNMVLWETYLLWGYMITED